MVFNGIKRNVHTARQPEFSGPHASAEHNVLRLNGPLVGGHSGDTAIAVLHLRDSHALQNLDAPSGRTLCQSRRGVLGNDLSVAGQPSRAQQIVRSHDRALLSCRLGINHHCLNPEVLSQGDASVQLAHAILCAGHDQ